jgi:hypothetical protein
MWQAKAILASTPFTLSTSEPEYQTLLANATNVLDATNILVAAENSPVLSAYWNYATQLEMNDPMLTNLATCLGITPDQIFQLFTAAGSLSI